MIKMLSTAAATYEEGAGSEINPFNMLLAIVYIVVVMALIYVILVCIDKFAKKRQNNEAVPEEQAPEESADKENNKDKKKDEEKDEPEYE